MSVKMSYKSKPNNSMNETGALSEGLWLVGVPLVSRMGLVVIELLRRKWCQEENATTEVSMEEMDTGRVCMPYGMKWECLM